MDTQTRVQARCILFFTLNLNLAWFIIACLYLLDSNNSNTTTICSTSTSKKMFPFSLSQWLLIDGLFGFVNILLLWIQLERPNLTYVLFANWICWFFCFCWYIIGTMKLSDLTYCEKTIRLFEVVLLALMTGYITIFHQFIYLFHALMQ